MIINDIKDINKDWHIYFLMRRWEMRAGESFLDCNDSFICPTESILFKSGDLSQELYNKISNLLDWDISTLFELWYNTCGFKAELKIMTLISKAILKDEDLLSDFYNLLVETYGFTEIDNLEETDINDFDWCDFSKEYNYVMNHNFEELLDVDKERS